MRNLEVKMWCKAVKAKEAVRDFFKNEKGDTNVIAIVLILVVVIALVVVFREAIGNLFTSLWGTVMGNAEKVDKEFQVPTKS